MRRKTSVSGTQQQDEYGGVTAISLDAAMETTASEHDMSPQTEYCIDLDLTFTPVEASELSTSNSPSRFFCRFDPVARKGRLLMLLFDHQGNSTLQEMSRMDVLRATQEAAKLRDESPAKASPFRKPDKTSPRRRRSGLQAQATVDGGSPPVCDVQRVHTRDIRRMENAFSASNEPSIILRKQAIFFSADPLRAIVLRDACLVYVPDGADSLLSMLKQDFLTNARDNAESPFEFRALEALLATLARYFRAQYDQLSPVIVADLEHLVQGNLDSRELERLREFKNTMNEFESQVDGVRRVLMELLDNEEDLRLLYLTKLYEEPDLLADLWSFDSEEAEVLIENYLQDIFSTRTTAELLQHRIANTESLVTLKLDSKRNYLLRVQLIFSLVSINISVGTLISGVFGMNLVSGLAERAGWFLGVVIFTIVFFIGATWAGILFFKRKGTFHSSKSQHINATKLRSQQKEESGGRSSTISLEGATETAISDHGSSPMANNNLGEGSTEPSEVSGANTPRHFFCRFDPVTKKDKLLMLLFDSKCNSTLNEMSRLDVLRVTQDASRFQREAEISPRFGKSRQATGSLRQSSQPGAADSGPLVCDVQPVHARDIRRMENAFSTTNEPSVVIRKQAIFFSADPLRAIVLRDLCLVYVPDGADSLLSMLKHDFASNACDGAGSPFEFRALEALLATLARYFRAQYDQIYPVIVAELEHLVQGNVDLRELERLREFKNTMNEFEAQVEGVRRVLMDLLDNEEDLRLLYLTKLYEDPSLLGNLFSFDSEEAEVLIENYLQDIFSRRTTAELLQHRISNTESLVTLKLDSKRNYLLTVQLVFSLVLVNIAVGTLVTGIFGMNLFSGLESVAHWFRAVVIAIAIFFALATGSGIVHFKKKGVMLT